MNKHVTIEWPYDQIVLDFTRAKRVVTEPLTTDKWDAIARAEEHIFEHGYISYTDVNVREEDVLAKAMWDHCYAQMDAADEFQNDDGTRKLTNVITHKVASRVAKALALLVFGPEFLLKS
jgi:hypothetical protein